MGMQIVWALRESLQDKLDVFLHRSIQRILGISIPQVKEEIISFPISEAR